MQISFYVPTRVIMGTGCIRQSVSEIAAIGSTALIVTGGKSAKLCGALDDITETLKANGQRWEVFDKVTPNPDKVQVQAGAKHANRIQADFIIAVGGGSPMDAGKAVAYFASEKALPIVAVPTTAGTGSEVTQYAILTDHELQTKKSIATPDIFPKLALLDAGYTMTLGQQTTINTAVDALSHAIEGMLTKKANPMTDMIAAEAIRIIGSILTEKDMFSSLDINKREKLLYASMLAGTVIANTTTTALHALGYSFTYFKDIDHGRANGLLLAEFLKFVAETRQEQVMHILSLMGIGSIGGISRLMTQLLGSAEDISEDEIKKYASIAIKAKNIQNTAVDISEEDLVNIYTASIIK